MKMKKKYLFIFLVLICGLIVSCSSQIKDYKIFDVKEYDYYIENFRVYGRVNSISNSNDAKIAAKKVWKKALDKINLYDFFTTDLFCEYSYYFDENSGIWLIHRDVTIFDFGTGMNAIIEQDGSVIAVWRDK